jgi:hypothetical protein
VENLRQFFNSEQGTLRAKNFEMYDKMTQLIADLEKAQE